MSSKRRAIKPVAATFSSGTAFKKLAAKNVRKSADDYLIYFFTLMFSVSLFYTFNSIGSQFAMMNMDDSQNFLSFASGMILMVSVFICVVIGALIVYANRFLLKRRKKEIGIYITLGMEQKDILALLMRETLLIGGISLVLGIVAGIALSQGLALITAKVTGVALTNLHFFFSAGAAAKSVLFFVTVFVFVHFIQAKEIRKMNLIDLIYAGRKNEILEIKGNQRKALVFLASLLLMTGGHVWILTKLPDNMMQAVGVGVVLVVMGTFLFFLAVADTMIGILEKRKKFYYSGLNMFVVRQIAGKIKSNIFSMAVISILMFASVTAIAAGLGGGRSIAEGSRESAPFDVSFTEFAQGMEYGEADKDLTQISMAEELRRLGFPTQAIFRDMAELSIYDIDGVDGSLFLSPDFTETSFLSRDVGISVISAEDYNQAMRLLGKPEIGLGSQEFALNYNVREVRKAYEAFAKKPKLITVNGTPLRMKENGLYRSSYKTALMLSDSGTLIVPEVVLAHLKPDQKVLNGIFAKEGNQGYAEFRDEMLKLPDLFRWQAREQAAVQIFSDTIILSYVGVYLGIVFLITAGAVLALQQLSQSADNVKRYRLLRRLGAEEKMIQNSVVSQLLVYFGMPIGIASIHSAVMIKGFYAQLTNLSAMDKTGILVFAVVVTGVIYSSYFLTTCYGSFRMLGIKGRRQ